MVGWMGMDGWMDGDGWLDGWMDGWTDRWMDGLIGCMAGWLAEEMKQSLAYGTLNDRIKCRLTTVIASLPAQLIN